MSHRSCIRSCISLVINGYTVMHLWMLTRQYDVTLDAWIYGSALEQYVPAAWLFLKSYITLCFGVQSKLGQRLIWDQKIFVDAYNVPDPLLEACRFHSKHFIVNYFLKHCNDFTDHYFQYICGSIAFKSSLL